MATDKKLEKLLAQQQNLKAAIAAQKKLTAERETKAKAELLASAGAAVEAAGLLHLSPEALAEVLKKAAEFSRSTSQEAGPSEV